MNNHFTVSQLNGINTKLKAFDLYNVTDVRWRAYMLATSYHETAGSMQPVEERGKGAGMPYGQKRRYNGTVYAEPDRLFYGRGDVQLTWYENYEMMGKLLNLPLLNSPELALVPEISAKIMIEGMIRGKSNRGDFTGVSLENYFNAHKEDPFNARRIINGLDCAKLIVGYYRVFLNALRGGSLMMFFIISTSLLMLGGCKPKQLINEEVAMVRDSIRVEDRQVSTYKSELNRAVADNISFVSEFVIREIYYDTNAQIDSVSGRYPVLREIVATNVIDVERSIKDDELLTSEDSIETTSFYAQNSSMEVKVETGVDQNRSVFKYVLVVLCMFLFLVLIGKLIL